MKNLSHGQQIKVAGFKFKKVIEVVTISGTYHSKGCGSHKSLEEYKSQNNRNGGPEVWTYQEPSVLTSDYPGKKEFLAEKAKSFDAALEVVKGEIVSIEGNEYLVKVNGESYSDPVAFIPVAKEG